MTLHHLRNLATLHGIPATQFASMPQSPKAFLQACNETLDKEGPISIGNWLIATKQKTFGQVRRNKQVKKVVVTPTRQALINHYWTPIRDALRAYVTTTKGGQLKAAQFIGTSSSQIHRWTCPKCEHDQEPSYSLGKAVEIFLTTI